MARKLRLAVVGFGRLGQACAEAVRADGLLELAGIVRRPESLGQALPPTYAKVPVKASIADLAGVDGALLCVPTEAVEGVAREILQARIPIVECASVEAEHFEAHFEALHRMASNYGAVAIVGAGWEPGAFTLIQRLFGQLIPKGQSTLSHQPGVSLHHTAAVREIAGVVDALCAEFRSAGGMQRYVYVQVEPKADLETIRQQLQTDPLFAGEETLVIAVASIAELEAGHGLLLERRETGGHQSLLLEARFEPARFAARIMVAAAHELAWRKHGGHRFNLQL